MLQVREVNFLIGSTLFVSEVIEYLANFDYTSKSMKICCLLKKIHFTHLQQYDENHSVQLARIGRHSEKKRWKRD